MAVQEAGCVFVYFCGGHKNNFRLQFRSSFNLFIYLTELKEHSLKMSNLKHTCKFKIDKTTYSKLSPGQRMTLAKISR